MTTQRVIYFSEIFAFFKKKERSLFLVGLFSFILTFVFLLFFKEPTFLAEATFKQSTSKKEQNSLLQSFLNTVASSSAEASARNIMLSKHLLGLVVEELGLQLIPKSSFFSKGLSLLQREIGRAPKEKKEYTFCSVRAQVEKPLSFFILPTSSTSFQILNTKGAPLAQGLIATPVSFEGVTLTAVSLGEACKKTFFTLLPKEQAVSLLSLRLKIKANPSDAHLLMLSCKHRQRQTAKNILNVLMSHFIAYLKKEQEEISSSQCHYLEKRKTEIYKDFEQALLEHASYLKESIGPEGFMGFSQEIELLQSPREYYSSRRHDLDLQSKKWEEEARAFISMQSSPWASGLDKKKALAQEELLLSSYNSIEQAALYQNKGQGASEDANSSGGFDITEELSGIDLETAQKLYSNYSQERESLFSKINELSALKTKMSQSTVEFGALSQVLTDPVSQQILQKAFDQTLHLSDSSNYSAKEQERFKDSLSAHKGFLSEHITHMKELLELKRSLIERKMTGLYHVARSLLENEKKLIEKKLSELSHKLEDLPAKWMRENQLKLKKDLSLSLFKGVANLIESKAIDHHLFFVESKPLDLPQAPLLFSPPRLTLLSLLVALLGVFFFFIFQLFAACMQGLPLSKDFLRAKKYPAVSSHSELFHSLAHFVFQICPHETVAIIGNGYGALLANLLAKKGLNPLRLQLDQKAKEDFSIYSIEEHHFSSLPGREFLQHPLFLAKLEALKKTYNLILIETSASLSSAEALALSKVADRFILEAKEDKEEALTPFSPEKVLCVLCH